MSFKNRYSVDLCVFPENVQKLSDKEAPTQRQFVKGSGCSKLTELPTNNRFVCRSLGAK